MTDQQLIECYLTDRRPEVFQQIVERHGPAVLKVCRRLLNDGHAAEDAFQATFLILVKNPPVLRQPELLGRWLAGVARRVASQLRQRSCRRLVIEKQWAEQHPSATEYDAPLADIRGLVRDQLLHLPYAYAQVLSLCYLDGLTHEEAARTLECPLGTVKVRLVRARRLLKDRLDRRGVLLGLAMVLLLVWQ